jgi:hypothetical protein
MTALTNLAEDDLLDLLFTNIAFPNVGDAGGLQPSTAAGSWFASLHTGDALSDTSTQQTDNEADYTGYGRQGIARSAAGWTVNAGTADNDALIQFGEMTAGASDTITDVGLGFASTGNGVLHFWGQVASDLVVNNGVNPQFAAGALDVSAN